MAEPEPEPGPEAEGEGGHRRRSIPVVYYLSRNRHLEHPHFIQVPLPAAVPPLRLREFTARLEQVRGEGMAALYSWSCKRPYKAGFVWHDLAPDDPILPAAVPNEYVLKGSELHAAKQPYVHHPSPPLTIKDNYSLSLSPPPPPPPPPPMNMMNMNNININQDPPNANASPNQSHLPSRHPPPTSLHASTQTDDPDQPPANAIPNRPSTSRTSQTLHSLIRADATTLNHPHALHQDHDHHHLLFPTAPSAAPRLSPATCLMHFLSCGSISVKDYRRYAFLPIYRPTYMHLPIPSPIYATASTSFPFLSTMQDKEYFSGSIVETKSHIHDDGLLADPLPVLKRSSSYNAHSCKSSHNWKDETEIDDSSRSTCLPRTMKFITSPLSDCPRSSSSGPDVSQTPPTRNTRIITKASSVVEPSRRKKDKLFRIEES